MSTWLDRKEKPQSDWHDFARDRARVIHSASFRRLQGKTQVLGVGESDFYRTRLTHSLEVAQIGSGIVAHLNDKYKSHRTFKEFIPNMNLIEALGLAHDIGHPPFGHKGEMSLAAKMRDFGGFEGNGQTLRICTHLGEASLNNGLNLTRRTLLGLVKYPCRYSDLKAAIGYTEKPPKCILDTEKDELEWILDILTKEDRMEFTKAKESKSPNENKKTIYKSFDCSIMELSDDIAYAVHDLEDAIALEIIGVEDFRSWVASTNLKEYEKFENDLFSGNHPRRKGIISKLVHKFIDNVKITQRNVFQEPLIDLNAFVDESIKFEIDELKNLTYKKVIKKHEIRTMEFKGGKIVSELFDAVNENTKELLPQKYLDRIESCRGLPRERIVCDFIAGMTDNYASMLYDRIFTTNSGSIFSKL